MLSTAFIIVNTIAKATFGEICREVGNRFLQQINKRRG